MNVIYIAIVAFVGGIVSSLLGWFDSQEPFAPRKFAASLVRALVAGIGFAAAYQYTDSLTPIDLALAFLGGSGVDVLGNRISGAIKAGIKGES
jgi:hypothetical protein